MVGLIEAIRLKHQGYVPENVQACRDYSAGKITLQEMWRIINRNIGVNVSPMTRLRDQARAYPSKGNWVVIGDGEGKDKQGYIARVKGSTVTVMLQDGTVEPLEKYQFTEHSSEYGRTRWYISE